MNNSLELLRSGDGTGDYTPLGERYGASPDEVLRIECTTGRPIGIFKRP
jgi:hypothetical protein